MRSRFESQLEDLQNDMVFMGPSAKRLSTVHSKGSMVLKVSIKSVFSKPTCKLRS